MAGFLQMWCWPAALVLTALIFGVMLCAGFFVLRGGDPAQAMTTGHWSFTPPPLEEPSQVAMHGPRSEAKAPLLWTALSFLMICLAVFVNSIPRFQRLWMLAAGFVFCVFTILLSVWGYTLRISADSRGLRVVSALGWRNVPWQLVKGVELRESSPEMPFSSAGKRLPFPGNTTRSYVFTGAGGKTLVSMSTRMEPPEERRRFLILCRDRTGLIERFTHIEVPTF